MASDQEVYDMTVDVYGDLLITGDFGGTVDFDASAATHNVTSWLQEWFVLKYSAAGTYVNVFTSNGTLVPGNSDAFSSNIITDNAGNIYITGWMRGMFDFDPSQDTNALVTAPADFQVFLAKYTSSGQYCFAEFTGGRFAKGLAISADSTIYLTGWAEDTTDFD